MDYVVASLGKIVEPGCPATWASLEPRLPQLVAHQYGTGWWLPQEKIRREEGFEFDLLIDLFLVQRGEGLGEQKLG